MPLSARTTRLLRGAAGAIALVWLGAPAWPEQIDDQLITLAFAHNWADSGLIRWSTGEVVEACSSFLQLTLAAAWIALGGPDANVFVKALAVLSGLVLVLFANARLPATLAGTLVLAALVTWEPTARWSFVGMETTLYALCLTVGWAGVFGAPPGVAAGLGALWLAATAHPEGNLHFALGALLALRAGGRARHAALALGAALALYHVLRVWTFGAVLPTPYLVKVAANPIFGDQWRQLGWELVTLLGVGAALGVGFRARALALLPVGVQVLLELRAEPDWMGHARHLLPGVWATAVAWCVLGAPRGASAPAAAPTGTSRAPPTDVPGAASAGGGRAGRAALAHAGVFAAVLAAAPWEPPTPPATTPLLRDPRFLKPPGHWFASALDTTQLEDVARIVKGVPAGGAAMLEDVGMPGNVHGVRVIDFVGLTDRAIALAVLGDESRDRALAQRFLGPPDRPVLVRRMKYSDSGLPRPVPWLRLPEATHVTYPQGTALWYRLAEERPTPAQIAERWARLHARYPSQGPVAWYHAMTEVEQGRLVEGARVADRMARRFPADPLAVAIGEALFAPFPLEDFDDERLALRRTSRPLPRVHADDLRLVLGVEPRADAGQLVRVAWSCDGAPEQVVVTQGTTRVPLPGWACPGDEARLRVEAIDGRPTRALPERLYVAIGAD